MNIYRIDHYYSKDHNKYCLFIESEIGLKNMIDILGSIQFAFEVLIDKSVSPEYEHILNILEKFYRVKDVKYKYKNYLDDTLTNEWREDKYKHPWGNRDTYINFNVNNTKITQIDLYSARESRCGENYIELMNKVLPKDLRFIEKILSYKNYYKAEC